MRSSASASTSTREAMTSWRRALTFNVVVLSAASLLNDISSEMIIPLLPFYLLALHADVFVIGLIEGAGESLLAVVRVVSGHRSDTVGRRKAFISGGYGLSTIAKGLLSVATVWPQVLAFRVGDRFGKGVRDPPRDALLAESTPEATRGAAFGVHRSLGPPGGRPRPPRRPGPRGRRAGGELRVPPRRHSRGGRLRDHVPRPRAPPGPRAPPPVRLR